MIIFQMPGTLHWMWQGLEVVGKGPNKVAAGGFGVYGHCKGYWR